MTDFLDRSLSGLDYVHAKPDWFGGGFAGLEPNAWHVAEHIPDGGSAERGPR